MVGLLQVVARDERSPAFSNQFQSKKNFQTNESKFMGLHTTGSLMVHWAALLGTIKNTAIPIKDLEIQYVSVDRLCIIQDNLTGVFLQPA